MILVFRIGIVLFRGFDFLNWHVAFLYGLPERIKSARPYVNNGCPCRQPKFGPCFWCRWKSCQGHPREMKTTEADRGTCECGRNCWDWTTWWFWEAARTEMSGQTEARTEFRRQCLPLRLFFSGFHRYQHQTPVYFLGTLYEWFFQWQECPLKFSEILPMEWSRKSHTLMEHQLKYFGRVGLSSRRWLYDCFLSG